MSAAMLAATLLKGTFFHVDVLMYEREGSLQVKQRYDLTQST